MARKKEAEEKGDPALALEDASAPAEEKKVEKPDLKEVLAKLVQRITVCKKNVETESTRAVEIKESVSQKSIAYGKVEKVKTVFRKYDKAKNGLLFKRNVLAYAAGEYNFEIPLDVFNSFWDLHADYSSKHGEKGVAWEQFHDLKVSIGIARELKRDKKKRELREANEEPDPKKAKTEE